MFDSTKLIGIVVRTSDGERVFWATSIKEYFALAHMKGIPETGTVVTLDRKGNYHEYTIEDWYAEIDEEGYHMEEVAACYPDEANEPDREDIERNEVLAAYEKQRQETLAKMRAQAEKIPF
jgi:hypothetical protein